ncbi:MAG TPA: CotH kinase family protein [Chitinispirillaceae bacterium]|nr:CotH kinase family protein [Chitinispirillaceae bacterium]
MFYGKVIHLSTTTALATMLTFSCDLFKPEKQETTNDSQDNEVITPDTTTRRTSLRPDGWEYASHDKDASADYITLFPDNIVNRMDIVISDSSWKVLMDDMTSMSGSFGSGGTNGMGGKPGTNEMQGDLPGDTTGMKNPGGKVQPGTQDTAGMGSPGTNPGTGDPFSGQIPQEFYDAAKDKQFGDSCSCTMMGMSISGKVDTTGGTLFCKPHMDSTGNQDRDNGGFGEMDNTEFLPREPIYIPATVEFNGKKWTRVGFRLKGNSSLVSAWGEGVYKLPFRIKTDEFEDLYPEIKNQRMYGFQNISLCNNYMDNTLVHEKIASDLFQSNNVPSAKSAFIRLYIDYGQGKKYFGLYTMAEVPDAPFLEKWFGNKKGNLYKPDGTGARFSTWESASFDELNNKDNSLSDVYALFTALHSDQSNAASWRTKLESIFDVRLFIKWLAINSAIGNWDAYGSMAHNYYLYNNRNILSWIPWDLGLSFSESGGMGQLPGNNTTNNSTASLTHTNVDSKWPLIRYILDDSTYYALYLNDLSGFATAIFNTGIAVSKIQAAHDLIAPFVTGIEAEQSGYTFLSSPADFENAFTSLVQFISRQSESISSITGNSP